MGKTKGTSTKKAGKAKSPPRYVLQKKSNITEYFVYEDKKELDTSLAMFKSLGISKADFHSFIINNEEDLTAFKDRIKDYAAHTPEHIDLSDDSDEKCNPDANNVAVTPTPSAERVTRSTIKIAQASTATTPSTSIATMTPSTTASLVPIKIKNELFCSKESKTGGTKLNFGSPSDHVTSQAMVPIVPASNNRSQQLSNASSPSQSAFMPSLLPTLKERSEPRTTSASHLFSNNQGLSNVSDFMAGFAADKGVGIRNPHWHIQVVHVKQGVDIAVIDFLKPRRMVVETHWAHKAEGHWTCFNALVEKAHQVQSGVSVTMHKEIPLLSGQIIDILEGIGKCNIRSEPDGPNSPKKIRGTSYEMKKLVWYMFVNAHHDGESIRTIIKQLIDLFDTPIYQQMYHATLNNLVKNETLLNDGAPGGSYWQEMKNTLAEPRDEGIRIVQMDYLRQIFMDEQIEEILQSAFSSEAIPLFSPSMYTDEMKMVAYGNSG